MFTPGQLVVCVDDDVCVCGRRPAVSKGQIYTVDVFLCAGGSGVPAVRLREVSPHKPHSNFGAARFRPLRPLAGVKKRERA